MTQVIIKPDEFGLQAGQAEEIQKGLPEVLEARKSLEEEFNDLKELEVTEENLDLFRALRLKIRDNRTKGIDPWHKKNKEVFLRRSIR